MRRARSWAGRAARRLVLTKRARHGLSVVLKGDALAWAIRDLSDRNALEATLATSLPPDIRHVDGFHDLSWLFSSNDLNHGVSRLRIDEAAHFYRHTRSIDDPYVAEVGRFHGGTAVLLAAAGARVMTIDDDAERQSWVVPQLEAALSQLGLRERVEIVVADALEYAPANEVFDLVILDAMQDYRGVRALFERWWPAVRAGGSVLLRNIEAGDPRGADVRRLVGELEQRPDVHRRPGSIGQWAHLERTGSLA